MLATTIFVAAGLVPLALGSALQLEKRASNGVYLANCVTRGTTRYSEMSYYNDAKGSSQNGQLPDEISWPSTNNGQPLLVTWEGQQHCGYYSASGATFCSLISNAGQSLSTGQYAGSGWNSYGANFSCYKDNGRLLYYVPEGSQLQHTCVSIYYCFQN